MHLYKKVIIILNAKINRKEIYGSENAHFNSFFSEKVVFLSNKVVSFDRRLQILHSLRNWSIKHTNFPPLPRKVYKDILHNKPKLKKLACFKTKLVKLVPDCKLNL